MVQHLKKHGYEYYEENALNLLWSNAFPQVRIREYKSVSGKCNTCEGLKDLIKVVMIRIVFLFILSIIRIIFFNNNIYFFYCRKGRLRKIGRL